MGQEDHELKLLRRRQNYAARRIQAVNNGGRGQRSPELKKRVEKWSSAMHEMLRPPRRRS